MQKVTSGTNREIWREVVPLDGGASAIVATGIRIDPSAISKVFGVLTLSSVVGVPVITAIPTSVNGHLVVVITNTALTVGNAAAWQLDVLAFHSIQQGRDAIGIGGIYVINAGSTVALADKTIAVDHTNPAFIADIGSVTFPVVVLPVKAKLLAATIRQVEVFAGTLITQVDGMIGTGTPGNASVYVGPLNLMQLLPTGSQGGCFSGTDLLAPDTNLSVTFTITATNNFGTGVVTNLTSGAVTASVLYWTTPEAT